MRGLLLKDILMLKSYARTLGALVIFYLIFGIVWDNVFFFAGMSGILCVMMVMSSFSYDNYAKWDQYGASLPVTRSDMVGAKYLLALLMAALGAIVSGLMYLVFVLVRKGDFSALIPIVLGTTAAGMFLISVLLPCIYKFGAEKARLVLMVAGVLIALIISAIAWFLPEGFDFHAVKVLLLMVLSIAPVVVFYLSYLLSCRIYRGKEL
ncbi:ABC-2 transporter permease [Oscillospiraceae bacterium LTW-04]|nr:ABC-2 transporter permease [Oscillospiraceae bacterium MB24-C1]